MKKKNIILFIFGLIIPSACVTASELPYITPEQAIDLAVMPRLHVKKIVHNATPAEIIGLNKSFTRINNMYKQILKDEAPIISDDILQAADTAEALEAKINAVMRNTAQPEDFIHLMTPPEAEDTSLDITTAETPNTDNILSPITQEKKTEHAGTLKDIIVEDEDASTKHIYRRKIFVKQ